MWMSSVREQRDVLDREGAPDERTDLRAGLIAAANLGVERHQIAIRCWLAALAASTPLRKLMDPNAVLNRVLPFVDHNVVVGLPTNVELRRPAACCMFRGKPVISRLYIEQDDLAERAG